MCLYFIEVKNLQFNCHVFNIFVYEIMFYYEASFVCYGILLLLPSLSFIILIILSNLSYLTKLLLYNDKEIQIVILYFIYLAFILGNNSYKIFNHKNINI